MKSQRKIVKTIDKFIFCIYNQDTFLKIYNFNIKIKSYVLNLNKIQFEINKLGGMLLINPKKY